MDDEQLQSLRSVGWALAGSALLAAVLMHYHPHGDDSAHMMRGVHGGLLLLIVAQSAMLGILAAKLGWRLLTALAFAYFVAGTTGASLAGIINGFAVPALDAYPAGEVAQGVGALAWELNQAAAKLGAIAAGIGIALYSVALWQVGHRVIGSAGLLVGGATALLQATGVLDMRFYGAISTYVAQLLWITALGVALAQSRSVSSPSNP